MQPQTPKKEDVPDEEGFINCCFSSTIRRDKWGIPSMIFEKFIKCRRECWRLEVIVKRSNEFILLNGVLTKKFSHARFSESKHQNFSPCGYAQQEVRWYELGGESNST
ncbi:hypothetical protein EDD22DRAFT_850345 [Suillus occidentalis]|nr:hypothetical protein EDD22DRAFT_850345 [Suillus occidentalis]